MLNKTLQTKLLKDYVVRQATRHDLIGSANNALRQSKQAIFSLHRDDKKDARKKLDNVHQSFSKIQKGILKKHPELKRTGAYLAALEEYVEGEFLYKSLHGKSIDFIKGLEIEVDQYIGGLSDLTGELNRQAVLRASQKDFKVVDRYMAIAEEVVGVLIKFDLTGHLRQKYDDAKRNLKRMESIKYDISLRDQ